MNGPFAKNTRNNMWSFHNPVSVSFGTNALDQLCNIPYRKILLVTSKGSVTRGVSQVVTELINSDAIVVYDHVSPNPDIADLDAAARVLSSESFDAIVALGGGSVLDTAKILAVLLANPVNFNLVGYFENILTIPNGDFLPVIAIPTTSGTGSEVTPFATVWNSAEFKKYSMTSPGMFPRMALLDPRLTLTLSWSVTLATGMDALCQAFESIWNRNATPLSIGISQHATILALRTLKYGKEIMDSPKLRSDLMLASLMAGLAISQTRTALCHSISYPITAAL